MTALSLVLAATLTVVLVAAHLQARGGHGGRTPPGAMPPRPGSGRGDPATADSKGVMTTAARSATTGAGVARCTFVDHSRSTYDYATGQALPGRTLPTEIRYPTAAHGSAGAAVAGARPLGRAGGYPTIVFAPGYGVTPDVYAPLLDAWVRAGFVVVAPTFPDTSPTAVADARYGDPEDDITNQPGDLAFVLRSALAASTGRVGGCAALRGLVAPGRVAVAGQSDGGDTAALLAYGRTGAGAGLGADLPIKAAAILSGSEWPGDAYAATVGDPALLVVQSATDACNPPQASIQLYESVVQKDRWFLALDGASHLGPYDGGNAAAFSTVVAVTTRFFRSTLTSHRSARRAPLAAGLRLRGATLTTGPTAPALAPLLFSRAACAAPAVRTS